MARGYWLHSKSEKKWYAQQMDWVGKFCKENNIERPVEDGATFIFELDGKKYIISNSYIDKHFRKKDTHYIYASPTRLIEIYTDLKDGHMLDSRGYRLDEDTDGLF